MSTQSHDDGEGELLERIRSRVEWTVGGGIVTLLVTIGAALAVR